MKLIETKEGELKFTSNYSGTNSIDIVHCSETLSEIKEGSTSAYIVAEECTNFARIHLLTDWSEDEALQTVATYLREEEGEEEAHLIAVFKLTIDQPIKKKENENFI